jgi:DNA-directed RNA polymerase alpha subunit
MKKMIKEFSIYLGLVSSTVTLISYKKQEDINKLREKLNESKNIISNIKEKVIELENFQIKHENLSLKLEGKSADFKDIIDYIKYHYDALKSKSISELLKNHHINELENSFGKAENNLENIFSILNKHNNEYINKFIGNNSLFDTFNLFLDN